MTSAVDDAVSLRFHLSRALGKSLYAPEPRSRLSFLWRSRSWLVVVVSCDLLALWALMRGSLMAIPLVVVPTLAAWLYDRRDRQIEDDHARPYLWEDAAYEMSRHILRTPYGGEGLRDHSLEILTALNEIRRSSNRLLDVRKVAAFAALANATTIRNKLLILSSLQLTLLAHAERLRVYALRDSDFLDEAHRVSIRRELGRMAHRGRRPISLGLDRDVGIRTEM